MLKFQTEINDTLVFARNYLSSCRVYMFPYHIVNIYFPVTPMRRYVSQDGFDSDQCGQTTETACKTLTPVLEQLHAMNSFVSPDLMDQVKDVWRKVYEKFQSIFDQVEEWRNGPVVHPLPTPPPVVTAGLWDTRYVFLEKYSDFMYINLKD